MLALSMPFPPSLNTYWRSPTRGRLAGRTLISARGRQYRKEVIALVSGLSAIEGPLKGRLSVSVVLMPPDRRRRDLDNYLKALLDALTHAEVWVDDEQIDRILVERGEVVKGGVVKLRIDEVKDE